ncbi:MAG: O-sialoglycoprotein endopeptidase [Parcubacteria group bacterium GW2011_GWA1_44_13]|uniref:tRNA N6-adenosine threonylcarbamoyltransferase n=1 Tax=Candidatus Nomurabacteria bacterium GW2011_GWB1_44_12 TaxID=1618748 RepID=A0A837IE08_9BACT|nr:MAG: O-sialoglycoprotein endopeptidase [Candidatus Nomurabacteria bacterium GW2011_GWD1_44_10]KKT37139.1 MAG: O-sialoglycoprotein endopeptidase [Candidatus Nomurabacteria bacterium GW2011_GWB1_44_12]KKT38434.1 MAG: O-sialoglycoprotein endopeptidase [Parcubacteria group bacterium GW2011_GWA1_44_13]HBB44184.1 tRNA (adenosine(37)-N6)-threonylcarbamoyltransferase complex transferase subunit TsaD [Candidatus Yonathbacteria bacterium]
MAWYAQLNMRILAIETSCDETGIAIVEARLASGTTKSIKVLANLLISQAEVHAQFGGVFPAIARREHAKNIVPLILHALKEAKLSKKLKHARLLTKKEDSVLTKIFHKESELFEVFKDKLLSLKIPAIDAIAVTSGPGLEPALWVGINTAEALGALWNVPVIPVNHMEGHVVAALLTTDNKQLTTYNIQSIQYPALALLISGGHTELVLMPSKGKYKMLGQTRDDAVGEAFDKVARMLGFAYPGGPEISKLAEKAPPHEKLSTPLPRPMLKSGDLDFSFSGLKTSVLYAIKKFETLTDRDRELIAKDFEDSVTEVLVAKTLTAGKKYNVKEIILGGGVTANKKIRKVFAEKVAQEMPGTKLSIPDILLSGDNGLMIGVAGLLRSRSKKHIIANGTLKLAKSVSPTLAELRKRK